MRAYILLYVYLTCSLVLASSAQSGSKLKKGFLKGTNIRFREQLRTLSQTETNAEVLPVNPCSTSPCNVYADCATTATSYKCTCSTGYEGDGLTCFASNLCVKTPYPCDANARCQSIGPAQVACTCNDGYHGNGKECGEIDPCSSGPCDNTAICKKIGPGKYNCECEDKFTMRQGRCQANSKGDDSQLQLEAAKQIAALRNIQQQAEFRQQEVEHENKIGDLERRVLDLGRTEAHDTDQKQDQTIKDLEDQVLHVQDVTMELAKRATEQNELLKQLAAHRPVTLPHEDPIQLDAPPAASALSPRSPMRSRLISPTIISGVTNSNSIGNGLRLATIVPKEEIQPQPLEPMANPPELSPPAEPTPHKLDVSKYTIAHIQSNS